MNDLVHNDVTSMSWGAMTLADQLGNVASEVGRARSAQGKNDARFMNASNRALDLIDRTLADKRWTGRLKELGRARETFCDAITGGELYGSSMVDLEKYFMDFAFFARK